MSLPSTQNLSDKPALFMLPVDFLLGGVTLLVAAALQGSSGTWRDWIGPGLLLVGWSFARFRLACRPAGRGLVLAAAALTAALAALLPAWPAADSSGDRVMAILWAMLAGGAWRAAARLASGPSPGSGEQVRILLLIAVLVATWAAYFTPCIVGVVDERWYGDLMTDFLEQVRAGVFPVLIGQGEFAWNGNVHPFRSAPMHHHLGALVDTVTRQRLSPLAVQHVVLLLCAYASALILYVGLRRLRPDRPWFALAMALLFAICPAITMSQVYHDMYMTAAALPVVVFVALCLVKVLETGSWRAWSWLGVGLGAGWFCHPPSAFLTTATVAVALLIRFVMAPVSWWDCLRAGGGGALFVATSVGYFVSMREITPLRHGEKATMANVIVPGLALVLLIVAGVLLGRTRRQLVRWLAIAGILAGLAVLHVFHPKLLVFATMVVTCWLTLGWVGRRFPATQLDRWPELLLGGCIFVAGAVNGPKLAGSGTVDAWIDAAVAGYPKLWLPVHFGGHDQLGLALAGGIAMAMVAVFVRGRPAARVLGMTVLVLCVMLAPIPGFFRFVWQSMPDEVVDIIGVGYPLRFLPVTVPFGVVFVFLALAEEEGIRWWRRARLVLLGLLPWAAWEHMVVVGKSWEFRHTTEQTRRHLRPENRALSKFHYDLQPLPRYHNHGVTDYRLETRLWLQRPGANTMIGPNEYARMMAGAVAAGWQDLQATQDVSYPAWLYFTPRITLAPGEHRLLTFDWQDPAMSGWLICRSENIYREYLLPEFGGSRSFGSGEGKHQTLSLRNSGSKPEEIELVFKREGAGAADPYRSEGPVAKIRMVNYDRFAAPVEIIGLRPFQMRVTAETDATVETFRVWLPGYRVSVDGRSTPHWRSNNGLLAFKMPAGSHVADIRFRGTPEFRIAVYWSLCAGLVVIVAFGCECVRWSQKQNHPVPAS